MQVPELSDDLTSVTMHYMQSEAIHAVMAVLKNECRQWETPAVTVIAERLRSPYTVLVSCVISLRTRDAVTAQASARLFERARDPATMVLLTEDEIAALIYPAGFYRTKARQIKAMSQRLLDEYAGQVPSDLAQLISLKGVGRKTANLVVTLGHGLPGICVDIHVHRITNRWGYVTTRSADQTEMVLRETLPPEYWIEINDLLVCFGQNRCLPVSPFCSACNLISWCGRVGVDRSR